MKFEVFSKFPHLSLAFGEIQLEARKTINAKIGTTPKINVTYSGLFIYSFVLCLHMHNLFFLTRAKKRKFTLIWSFLRMCINMFRVNESTDMDWITVNEKYTNKITYEQINKQFTAIWILTRHLNIDAEQKSRKYKQIDNLRHGDTYAYGIFFCISLRSLQIIRTSFLNGWSVHCHCIKNYHESFPADLLLLISRWWEFYFPAVVAAIVAINFERMLCACNRWGYEMCAPNDRLTVEWWNFKIMMFEFEYFVVQMLYSRGRVITVFIFQMNTNIRIYLPVFVFMLDMWLIQ